MVRARILTLVFGTHSLVDVPRRALRDRRVAGVTSAGPQQHRVANAKSFEFSKNGQPSADGGIF
jgi:hypothetical protein